MHTVCKYTPGVQQSVPQGVVPCCYAPSLDWERAEGMRSHEVASYIGRSSEQINPDPNKNMSLRVKSDL